MAKKNNFPPTILIILDGFGLDDYNKPGNAVTPETAPNIFDYKESFPSTKLKAHGTAVGLFEDQTGNSEAGHFNIGAGRTVKQDLVRISDRIDDGRFFKNHAFKQGLYHAQKYDQAVHVMILLTDQDSPHAKLEHLYALLKYFREKDQRQVYLHLFTDGRDSPPKSALQFLEKLRTEMKSDEKIATIMGRFYGMDRNKNWERTHKAYQAITQAEAEYSAETAEEAIKQAYKRDETDEYISPTVITQGEDRPRKVEKNDVVYFMNARSDRARQLTKVFVQDKFLDDNPEAFEREYRPENIRFVALTDFGPDLPGIFTAFPSPDIPNCLAKAIDDNREQLYISETEKYAHITFFLNGGYPKPINGEDREVIKSDDVRSFTDKPEMESKKITQKILTYIQEEKYDFICTNFPNADMVAHTGDFSAAKQAINIVDQKVKKIVELVRKKDGRVIITSDHGNAEKMGTKQNPITEHTTNLVPFILIDEDYKDEISLKQGKLGDIATTLLKIMEIEPPEEMTGEILFEKK